MAVDVVTYGNQTAQVNNERAYQHILRERTEMLLALEQSNKVLKQSGSSGEAAAELQRLADATPHERATKARPSPVTLHGQAQNLRSGMDVAQLVERNNAHIAQLTAQSQLRREQ